jgi:hypothetical protein
MSSMLNGGGENNGVMASAKKIMALIIKSISINGTR